MALRIALQSSNPNEDFDKASGFNTATGLLFWMASTFLESCIQDLQKTEPIDQLEPTEVEVAELFAELIDAEGIKAAHRTNEFVNQHLQSEICGMIFRSHRRRSYTRGLHAIRRSQDSWKEILKKAELAPSKEELLDPDFELQEESSSSESEDEDSELESQRKRTQTVHASNPVTSSSLTPGGSISNQAGLLTRRRTREQIQQHATSSSSSSGGGQTVPSASTPLEKKQHPVYVHPLFKAEDFERLSNQADEVGQRKEITEGLYEETLMRAEALQLTEQERWGAPTLHHYRRAVRMFESQRLDSEVNFTPRWLPANLRADIYREPL